MNSVWDYFRAHQSQILDWLWPTIWLAALPLLIGLALALPIGWVANRYRWTYPPIVSGAGLMYTIPSIVLFFVLPGILGRGILDPFNVAVALTVYTLALLVRIVADGLSSVPEETMAAATAMGYGPFQRLVRVQLPMAVPVIGAGLRVAAVSNVSLVSVASIIGVTQLGLLFVESNTDAKIPPAVVGLILFVAMALVFDALILLMIRMLTPWQRVAVR